MNWVFGGTLCKKKKAKQNKYKNLSAMMSHAAPEQFSLFFCTLT